MAQQTQSKRLAIITTSLITVQTFLIAQIEAFQTLGYKVDIITNVKGFDVSMLPDSCQIIHCPFSRNPFSFNNLRAFIVLMRLRHHYDMIYTHTPIASFLSRFVFRRSHAFIVYFAHGFHFFRGAPILNWLLYYPLEKFLARFTNLMFTINQEDYDFSIKKLKVHRLELFSQGVGVNHLKVEEAMKDTSDSLKLMIPIDLKNKVILMSIGEVNRNKNHLQVIKALHQHANPKFVYIIIGPIHKKPYQHIVAYMKRYNIQHVYFMGSQPNPLIYLKMADFFVFPSLREGLPVSLMEAMVMNLPILASDIRGNRDLIKNYSKGQLFDVDNLKHLVKLLDLFTQKPLPAKKDNEFSLNFDQYRRFDRRLIATQITTIIDHAYKSYALDKQTSIR